MSYDGATLRLYVDGVEQPSVTTNRTPYAAPAARVPDLRVGRSDRDRVTIAAALDHVLLYNRALTAAEITAL